MNHQLNYPLDPIDKQNLTRFIRDEVMSSVIYDAIWKNVYYYSSQFESLNGMSLLGNAPTINDTGITMATAAVGSSTSGIIKDAIAQKVLTFGRNQSFRTTLEFGVGSVSNMSAHFTVGIYGTGNNYYGFEILNGALSASSSNDTTLATTTIALGTLSALTTYELEARLDSSRKSIVFSIDGVEKGIITTNVPNGINTLGNPITNGYMYDWLITTSDANAKSVSIGNFEYLQERYTKSK